MTLADVHFSSATDLWSTPQEFFDSCDKIFRFAVDVCAPADNAKCAKYFTPEDDRLSRNGPGRAGVIHRMAAASASGCAKHGSPARPVPLSYVSFRRGSLRDGGVTTRPKGTSGSCVAD